MIIILKFISTSHNFEIQTVNSNLTVIFFNFKPNGKFKPKGHIFYTLNPTVNSNLNVIFLNFKPNGKFKPNGQIFEI